MNIKPLYQVKDQPIGWLIEGIWTGVGVIGGIPKAKKTFLALDIAQAVASGDKLWGKYKVMQTGPVVYFAGEDGESDIKKRLPVISRQLMICTDKPKLDDKTVIEELEDQVASLSPKLLIFDPFVRFHTSSENHVTPILDALRRINIEYGCSVILVHHLCKGGHGGQGLRGSGDLHAWGDSNIYPIKPGLIEIEHRHAPGGVVKFQADWTESGHGLTPGQQAYRARGN